MDGTWPSLAKTQYLAQANHGQYCIMRGLREQLANTVIIFSRSFDKLKATLFKMVCRNKITLVVAIYLMQ